MGVPLKLEIFDELEGHVWAFASESAKTGTRTVPRLILIILLLRYRFASQVWLQNDSLCVVEQWSNSLRELLGGRLAMSR